jgi:hypothetical protein
LSRRFQKIDVSEPSVSETVSILRGLKSRFEEHHGVKYTTAAISNAAELSAKYITDRHLPDKAIDVIDEAGAAQRIQPKSKQKKVIGKQEINTYTLLTGDMGGVFDAVFRKGRLIGGVTMVESRSIAEKAALDLLAALHDKD